MSRGEGKKVSEWVRNFFINIVHDLPTSGNDVAFSEGAEGRTFRDQYSVNALMIIFRIIPRQKTVIPRANRRANITPSMSFAGIPSVSKKGHKTTKGPRRWGL
jgi:hypothetical protein